ncbi:hypothetical protein FOC4_g10014466 [Fusarium odoratissimum]|uniref:DNA ligase D 3'-phosphoesterase domain-containing protein n=1 Tax=Fusarium oxysporum f. sp. cubense (strain race 4) TaxID=2502994 RepID=N1R6N2_FUSC4|nr:hypothetical protein FOC4_g10014466 [Fusarium odoratissimum]
MVEKRPPSPGFISNPFIKKRNLEWTLDSPSPSQPPTTADIESGSATVEDHLSHFKAHLSSHILSQSPLSISSYSSLYTENFGSSAGAHFVIHQHDHPIAGTHYDLRLQINETSSASWAIMYGPPGDPQSIRLNRNATETRIHCLWRLPQPRLAHFSFGIREHIASSPVKASMPQRLIRPLQRPHQNRKIRIRLHGSRLPDPYVLNLRLTRSEDVAGRARSGRTSRKRRRRHAQTETQPETSGDDSESDESEDVPSNTDAGTNADNLSAMEREIRELEDEEVRRTNAYPGASNTIGSVHQRRCVLTGRLGADILQDEGVDKFIQRQGWKPVLK